MATAKTQGTQLDSLLAALTQGNTNRSTSTSAPAFNNMAGQSASNLLQQISGLTKQDAIADSTGVINSISQNALRANMPSIASSGRGAGMYNSTTQQQLTDNLQAQITAANQEAIQANILNYANASSGASNAIANLNNSSRVQTSQSGGSSNDALKAMGGQFLLSQGLGALKKGGLLDWDSASSLGDSGASSLVSGLSSTDVFSRAFTDNFASMGAGIGSGVGGAAADLGSSAFDSISGGIGDVLGGVGDTIGDVFSGIGSWTGWWANGGRLPGKEATNGKDNLVVGAGGGEVILPVDTVKALDAKLGENWVDDLIKSTHRTVIPDPTPAAKAKAAAVK